jgi:histo-blood group ABO system transferase
MVMDYDQLVLCDLAPMFELDLGDHLLAAHMQGPGVDMSYAMRVWLKRPIPDGWEHVASHPYFLMPPVMNLKAMREAGTWANFLKAHAAFGADEQLSLTAATEGRTLPIDRKWNLFPRLHIADGEVPEGVIHWSGWPKPWHKGAKVWRPDIWESEKSSWEHLRMGIWQKPLSVELDPEDDRSVTALAQRGWRVKVYSSWDHDGQRPIRQPGFPDVESCQASREDFQRLLNQEAGRIDQVRLGAWEDPATWLDGAPTAPEYLVLKGGMDADEVERILGLGYTEEARIMSGEWPAGGPLPRALDYHRCQAGTAVRPGEDLYLRLGENNKGRIGVRLALWAKTTLPPLVDRKKIGLSVIATADKRMNLRPFLRSLRRNFLPGHEVTVFLFADGTVSEEPNLRVIPVQHNQRPGMTPSLYSTFVEHAAIFDGMEYLFHLDIDMRVIGKVGEEILSDLVGTLHPGFHDQPRAKFTYERRPESTAWISPEEGTSYFSTAFQGGKTERYLCAARVMAERIDADAAKGITAVWRDESHWNRYLIDHPPQLVLSPSYCWHPDGRTKKFEGKIAMVSKDEAEIKV